VSGVGLDHDNDLKLSNVRPRDRVDGARAHSSGGPLDWRQGTDDEHARDRRRVGLVRSQRHAADARRIPAENTMISGFSAREK
jgi:hypothetical protein